MTTTTTRARLTAIALIASLGSTTIPAIADAAADKAACAEAYHSAQTSRKAGALKKAREALLLCASDRCPAVLQPDCTRWLGEVEATTPSIVLAAVGPDGRDVTDVRVTLDGEVVEGGLDGKAIAVDPGSHTLKFERASASPIERTIVVREGEKARVVSVSWAPDPKSETARSDGLPAAETGPPTAAWILGGIGLAGLATFGTMAGLAMSRRSELQSTCYGSCDPAEIDSVKRQFVVADVALGVGLVSLGVATYLFLAPRGARANPEAATQSARIGVDVAPKPGGGALFLSGRF